MDDYRYFEESGGSSKTPTDDEGSESKNELVPICDTNNPFFCSTSNPSSVFFKNNKKAKDEASAILMQMLQDGFDGIDASKLGIVFNTDSDPFESDNPDDNVFRRMLKRLNNLQTNLTLLHLYVKYQEKAIKETVVSLQHGMADQLKKNDQGFLKNTKKIVQGMNEPLIHRIGKLEKQNQIHRKQEEEQKKTIESLSFQVSGFVAG